MREININDVNRLDLETLYFNSETGSKIFTYKDRVYKFYGDISLINEFLLKLRLEILSSVDMPVLVSPDEMIVERDLFGNKLKGVVMEKIEDSVSLYELSKDVCYLVDYFISLINFSIGLSNIHNRKENIILSDANFTNVLIKKDDKGNYRIPRFIDVDSASIKRIPTNQQSYFGTLYYLVSGKKYKASKNNDRLVGMLCFLNSIFKIDIYSISEYEYDRMSEIVTSLKEIRKLFLDLKNCKVPYVPYFYEFLDFRDAYSLKKNKII